jgi:hypothetical protein
MELEYKDILGNEIKIGNVIAIATQSYGELKTGIVLDLIKQKTWNDREIAKVTVRTVGSSRNGNTYPSHLLVINTSNMIPSIYKDTAEAYNRYWEKKEQNGSN